MKGRKWVFHATLLSRAKGQFSVLACLEVVIAVIAYWWIAEVFNSHIHLLSSAWILPLLLMRTKKSMEKGVEMFVSDWFNLDASETWSKRTQICYGAVVVLGCCFVSFLMTKAICNQASIINFSWLPVDPLNWRMGGVCAILSGSLAFILKISLEGVHTFRGKYKGTLLISTGLVAAGVVLGILTACQFMEKTSPSFIAGGLMGVLLGGGLIFLVVSLVRIVGADDEAHSGFGFGFSLRALICRFAATILHCRSGLQQIPGNWKESHFLTDLTILPELLPGLLRYTKKYPGPVDCKAFTLEGLRYKYRSTPPTLLKRVVFLIVGFVFFVPTFLYRANIKATAWFWWPLAMMLKAVPRPTNESDQVQALTWPWRNPCKMVFLMLGGVILASVVYGYYDEHVHPDFEDPHAVWLPIKVFLGLDWKYIAPWHWALFVLELSGLIMLYQAADALSHARSNNWHAFAKHDLSSKLELMAFLERIHSLAFIAFFNLGLGMCIVSFPAWQEHLPDNLVAQLKSFYDKQGVLESDHQQDKAKRLKEAKDKQREGPTAQAEAVLKKIQSSAQAIEQAAKKLDQATQKILEHLPKTPETKPTD